MISKELGLAIETFCGKYCKAIVSVILYGSQANGTATAKSDVDLIVIDDSCMEPFRIQRTINGFPIQATIMNYKDMLNALCESRKQSNPFFPISLEQSSLLYDTKGLGAYLTDLAKEIVQAGPVAPGDNRLELQRISLVNMLSDGLAEKYIGNSFAENCTWAASIIIRCEAYLLHKSGDWLNYNRRLRKQALMESFPSIYSGLNRAMEDFLSAKDTKLFADNIKSIMNEQMSFGWDTHDNCHASVF
ncbi:nucleotidyltransferase domain-containing protein [Pseudoalteromonas piscicida]|uniref:nucleotidyltransferase domain-containing protein n=1 Tax=Pseudoalteromonas piscicida TaxID=43662 RepID=UPI003C7E20C4